MPTPFTHKPQRYSDGTFIPRCWSCLRFRQQHAVIDRIETLSITIDNLLNHVGWPNTNEIAYAQRLENAKARLRALVLQCSIDEGTTR